MPGGFLGFLSSYFRVIAEAVVRILGMLKVVDDSLEPQKPGVQKPLKNLFCLCRNVEHWGGVVIHNRFNRNQNSVPMIDGI